MPSRRPAEPSYRDTADMAANLHPEAVALSLGSGGYVGTDVTLHDIVPLHLSLIPFKAKTVPSSGQCPVGCPMRLR
jgi:hypothetical protein